MFNRENQPTITESLVQLDDSVVQSADSTADSSPDLSRIGLWVWAFSLTDVLDDKFHNFTSYSFILPS